MDNKVKAKIREGVWCSVFGAAWVNSRPHLSNQEKAEEAKIQADLAVQYAENPEYMKDGHTRSRDL